MRLRIIKTWQWKVKISHSTFNDAMHVRLSTGVQRLPTVQRFAVMRSLLFMSWHSCCHSSCGPLLPCLTWSFVVVYLNSDVLMLDMGSDHILWHYVLSWGFLLVVFGCGLLRLCWETSNAHRLRPPWKEIRVRARNVLQACQSQISGYKQKLHCYRWWSRHSESHLFRVLLPDARLLGCWNHILSDVECWLHKHKADATETLVYKNNVRELLECDSMVVLNCTTSPLLGFYGFWILSILS